MMLRAYTIFDNKAVTYSPPFFVSTDAAAIRMVQDLVDDPANNQVGRHPKDFTLFLIGTFETDSALILGWSPIVHICEAVQLVRLQSSLNFGDLSAPTEESK